MGKAGRQGLSGAAGVGSAHRRAEAGTRKSTTFSSGFWASFSSTGGRGSLESAPGRVEVAPGEDCDRLGGPDRWGLRVGVGSCSLNCCGMLSQSSDGIWGTGCALLGPGTR